MIVFITIVRGIAIFVFTFANSLLFRAIFSKKYLNNLSENLSLTVTKRDIRRHYKETYAVLITIMILCVVIVILTILMYLNITRSINN